VPGAHSRDETIQRLALTPTPEQPRRPHGDHA
jgi:hypothetical protein